MVNNNIRTSNTKDPNEELPQNKSKIHQAIAYEASRVMENEQEKSLANHDSPLSLKLRAYQI